MFFKKIFEDLDKRYHEIDMAQMHLADSVFEQNQRFNTFSDKLIENENNIKALFESNESYNKCIKELQEKNEELYKKIDAVIEFLKSDRNDINALIQIVRKLQSKKIKN